MSAGGPAVGFSRALNRVLTRAGVGLTRTVPADELTAALRRLAPYDCGHRLVRIGGDHDGGYLVPDVLDGIVANLSAGVADNASFELELLDRGIPSSLVDPSVDGPPPYLSAASFRKLAVAPERGPGLVTIEEWVEDVGGGADGDLMLQMDVEGAEYESLLATPQAVLRRFRVVLVELHDVDKIATSNLALASFRSLLRHLAASFQVAHTHPNTHTGVQRMDGVPIPRCVELTLLRRDHVHGGARKRASLPHPLDQPNVAGDVEVHLPYLDDGT